MSKREYYEKGELVDMIDIFFNPIEALRKCRIDPMDQLLEPPVLISINNAPIFYLGDFSLVMGKAKSRKTFCVSALAAAAISGSCGIECINGIIRQDANKVIYFDTEQSPF